MGYEQNILSELVQIKQSIDNIGGALIIKGTIQNNDHFVFDDADQWDAAIDAYESGKTVLFYDRENDITETVISYAGGFATLNWVAD